MNCLRTRTVVNAFWHLFPGGSCDARPLLGDRKLWQQMALLVVTDFTLQVKSPDYLPNWFTLKLFLFFFFRCQVSKLTNWNNKQVKEKKKQLFKIFIWRDFLWLLTKQWPLGLTLQFRCGHLGMFRTSRVFHPRDIFHILDIQKLEMSKFLSLVS